MLTGAPDALSSIAVPSPLLACMVCPAASSRAPLYSSFALNHHQVSTIGICNSARRQRLQLLHRHTDAVFAATPDPGTHASAAGRSKQHQGRACAGAGRWLASGGVSCFTFISRPPSPPSALPPSNLLSARSVREIAQATLLHHPPQPSSTAPGPLRPDPSTTTASAIITIMSQKHVPDRARKYKEDPVPVASQKMVS